MQVAVVGAGRLGLLIAQVLREYAARVTVFVRSEASRAAAASLDLETEKGDPLRESCVRGFDVAVDATGDPAGFVLASSLVRPRGTLILKSTIHGETPVAFSPLVVDEITIVGSRCGPFDRAIDLLARGRVRVEPLLAAVYPLERFAEAFEHARRGLKVVMRPA
jgi:alcohol dehydrogenase